MSEDRGVGGRLREIRLWRRKSLRAVAELAGISESHLSNLEAGRRALDRRSLMIALAQALEVSPSEFGAPPAAGRGPNGGPTGRAIQAVRQVLLAADLGDTGGDGAVPLPLLEKRCREVLRARQLCQDVQVGAVLPGLLADLHATSVTEPAALRWLVLVSVHAAQGWLRDVGAPLELSWRAAVHARHAAQRFGDPHLGAVATFGVSRDLIAAGALGLADQQLAEAMEHLDTSTGDGQQLTAVLALTGALRAAAGRRHDATAAVEFAAELAEHSGAPPNAWWFDFSPANVAVWRMDIALEAGDIATAVAIAEAARPGQLTASSRRSAFWMSYARALAHRRGQVDVATRMLRQAEDIYPARVRRHPFVRETVLHLLPRARSEVTIREIRGLVYRMGLSA